MVYYIPGPDWLIYPATAVASLGVASAAASTYLWLEERKNRKHPNEYQDDLEESKEF